MKNMKIYFTSITLTWKIDSLFTFNIIKSISIIRILSDGWFVLVDKGESYENCNDSMNFTLTNIQ